MTKRYFQKEYDECYWVFDSEVITEKEVDEKLEYDSKVLADSMQGDEVEDRLNNYENELTFIKTTIQTLYETEQTNIGKNTLQQLIEAIK